MQMENNSPEPRQMEGICLCGFLIRLSGFPVRFSLLAKTEADGADAEEQQRLIGVDSAGSVLTST